MARNKTNAEFEAEMDARTLRDAEVIKTDGRRLVRAQKAAGRLAKEAEKEIRSIKKVAKLPQRKKKKRG